MVPVTTTFANLTVGVQTGGNSYTNTQVGLYTSAGVLIGASAVLASAGTNSFGSASAVTVPVVVIGGQSLTVTGSPTAFVWGALHMGTNSATSVIFYGPSGGNILQNIGTTAATARSGLYTGHATNDLATIGNLTPASITQTSAAGSVWMGVS